MGGGHAMLDALMKLYGTYMGNQMKNVQGKDNMNNYCTVACLAVRR